MTRHLKSLIVVQVGRAVTAEGQDARPGALLPSTEDLRDTRQGRRQKSPVSPSRSRIAWLASRVCGRQPAESRSPHQACARSLSFLTEIVAPGSRPASQRSMCSPDRKRVIVLQVKTTSSHQRAAGTRQWKSRLASSGR
jgi:hypothetical protein